MASLPETWLSFPNFSLKSSYKRLLVLKPFHIICIIFKMKLGGFSQVAQSLWNTVTLSGITGFRAKSYVDVAFSPDNRC